MSFFSAFTVGWSVGEVGEGYIHESCNGSCRLWHQSLWNVMLAICFDQIQCKKWVQTKITGHDCAVAPDASIVVKIDFIFQCTLIDIGFTWGMHWHMALFSNTYQDQNSSPGGGFGIACGGTFQFNHSEWIGKSFDKYLPVIFIHSQGMKGQPRWKIWTLLGQGAHINISRYLLQVPAAVPAGSWDTLTGSCALSIWDPYAPRITL